eukprot:m.84178 g.84178  ORF g.84178 m.84178 type:complete len:180 (+) comp15007_c0_seq1:1422-1961(+)
MLQRHFVEPKLIRQIFKQIFYFINATLVNNILLRKDCCHWSKGMQVRYNLTKVEEWARKNGLDDVSDQLAEAIEISKLLQVNKTRREDVDVICETCEHLNTLQIQKILTMYTPGDYEERVPTDVIRAVMERGKDKTDPTKLMMDAAQLYPVTFPFSPAAPKFPSIKLPASLCIDCIEKI